MKIAPPDLMAVLEDVQRRVEQARSILLGLDFDGTLVPLPQCPQDAVLPESVRNLLRKLNRIPQWSVMIASGRCLADVSNRVALPELIYAGNHGLEIRGPGFDFLQPRASELITALQVHVAVINDRLNRIPGILIEEKVLTTSIHERNVATEFHDQIQQVVREVVSTDSERFVLTTGHHVWEIRPRIDWHKGRAIEWVRDKLSGPSPELGFYLGDDQSDEDGFASLPGEITVKVGTARPTRAQYSLPNPLAVHNFLEWLLEIAPSSDS